MSFQRFAGLFCIFAIFAQFATCIPLIIDTDIGEQIDDTWAIGYTLARPESDVRMILSTSKNTVSKARLVAKLLSQLGRTNIDVGIGAQMDDYVGAQEKYAVGYNTTDYPRFYTDGIARVRQIIESEERVQYLAIGPLTNLAYLLSYNRHLAKKIDLVMMGGSFYKGYGLDHQVQEANIYQNVMSALMTFAPNTKLNSIRIAPADVGSGSYMKGDYYKQFLSVVKKNPHSMAAFILQQYKFWFDHGAKIYVPCTPSTCSVDLYDPTGAVMANPLFDIEKYFKTKTAGTIANDEGFTNFDPSGHPATVLLDWKNDQSSLDEFWQHLIDTLSVDYRKLANLKN
eukprot:TRINITY_DN776026_c0_g1_i1.p1 TRINITY_DN776026_c0_g1~~TRINITY_DN776026_c0_g1_i1.p1  ORF type:complete len:341 (-),score=93.75 TRINITY_DN776026_c0_g1_i1:248-1270(-)